MQIDAYLPSIRRLEPDSHKGQNGKVLLIGGSDLFHAASRWSLDVLSSMVDMVFYSSVPENNALIQEAKGEFWSGVVVPRFQVEDYVKEADVILIGPGMTRFQHEVENPTYTNLTTEDWEQDTYKVTNYLLSSYPEKKWVIDAGALQMVEPSLLGASCIITPHADEYQRLLERITPQNGDATNFLLKNHVTVLLKGSKDHVFNQKQEEWVSGGNAGMTKGGTGDVLAGIVAGLYCFTDDPFVAAIVGSVVNKRAGDALYAQVGPFFTTNQLVVEIPKVLKQSLYV